MKENNHKTDWRKFIEKTSKNPVRPLLVEAIKYVKNKSKALDVAAGALNESKYLLSEGFQEVVAFDSDKAAEEFAKQIQDSRFSFFLNGFEDFIFSNNTFDLINAQYALPFIDSEKFDVLMKKVFASLKSGGVFTGQLFGIKDTWNKGDSGKTFHTAQEARKVFKGMKIIKFEEREFDKVTALGQLKHWHVFDIIAEK